MTPDAIMIEDSICDSGSRISTLELYYPRFIHGEFMTHRLFSRNAASSRAIPCKLMRHQVWNYPAMPIHWGANQPGMQADNQLSPFKQKLSRFVWRTGGKLAVMTSWFLSRIGLHKQIANRVLEPWQIMKVIVTSTEWANFLWLRDHSDAQPEIRALAISIDHALGRSTPTHLKPGQWHSPYADGIVGRRDKKQCELARLVSVSCCAQVSYNRDVNDSIERANKIHKMLIDGQRVHASPFEHQATPISTGAEEGVTHQDANGDYWSGNLKGWIQHRQLVEGHTKW